MNENGKTPLNVEKEMQSKWNKYSPSNIVCRILTKPSRIDNTGREPQDQKQDFFSRNIMASALYFNNVVDKLCVKNTFLLSIGMFKTATLQRSARQIG